jgi:DNA-binding Lrp family transcriptional regulator
MNLDATDLRILDELQRDGALSNVELARRVHLSPSPCLARVKALETGGVIQRYVALCGAAALGLGLNVFISISLKSQSKEALAEFERRIGEHDEVMECYLMTGDSDYLIRVAVADIGALEKFILEQLTPIPGIEKIRSSFALKQVRYKTALPLPVLNRLDSARRPSLLALAAPASGGFEMRAGLGMMAPTSFRPL